MKKSYLLGASALALFIAGITIPNVHAVTAIDENRDCQLTLSVSDTAYGDDLSSTTITVNMYQVATVSGMGEYTSLATFSDLDLTDIDASAETWVTLATEAMTIIDENELAATTSFTIKDGVGSSIDTLDTGLYLVVADDVNTELYTYSFTPYLISLPDNEILHSSSSEGTIDEWLYEVSASLKPEQAQRYGSLRIIKSLTNYNETLDKTTFVFSIEGKNENDEIVYSNVAAVTHTSSGEESALLENIPAGLEVTVTEVYSGASYTLTSDASQTVTIKADEVMEVTFTNTYDDELNPSYGVVNHFEYSESEGWIWTQSSGNSESE